MRKKNENNDVHIPILFLIQCHIKMGSAPLSNDFMILYKSFIL